jgi:putative ABC transport system substrate-binding protein
MAAALFAAAALLLAASFTVEAQPAARVYRVGFISPLSGSPEPSTLQAFRQGLRELGYVEGKNVIVETRFGEGRAERLPGLVAELLGLKVDVLMVGGSLGALTARRATTSVPVVFAGVTNPVPHIVPSLARPGGNVTGVTFGVGGVGFAAKWVELLREAVPGISHIAVLSNSTEDITATSLGEIQAGARTLAVKPDLFDAVDDATLDKAFAAIGASGAQGMIVASSPLFVNNRVKLVRFAAEKRLPTIYFFKLFTDAGGLMSYGGSLEESYQKAAAHVDKILKGAKPADVPVEQPRKFELVINRRAAKALGVKIPQSLLVRADHVID